MNYNEHITDHFTWHDSLYLPSWKTYHLPSDLEKSNVIKLANVLEKVRSLVNSPIIVHCWIRPLKVNNPDSPYHGQSYNAFCLGAPKSAHTTGSAVDFHVQGKSCESIRNLLIPHLVELGIRMENNSPNGNWIHLDTYEVPSGGNRYFSV